MNEKIKNILVKITLTIPALIIGIISAIIFILKPVIKLWSEEEESPTETVPDTIPHDFH